MRLAGDGPQGRWALSTETIGMSPARAQDCALASLAPLGRGKQRDTGAGRVTTGRRWVTWPQAKGHLDTWSPQKLGQAGRTLPWNLQREHGPVTP